MAVACRTVGAEDRVLAAHVNVDVRMIVWRRGTNAIEFPCPDANFLNCVVVPELWEAARHQVRTESIRRVQSVTAKGCSPGDHTPLGVFRTSELKEAATPLSLA